MSSFEDLGLAPELVQALAAEGIERPSRLQEEAVPVLRRGNNLVARAGPGAGVLVAYGAALLDRLPSGSAEADDERPGAERPDDEGRADRARPLATVLVPTRERATALARSLGVLSRATGHRIAALAGPWVRPEDAAILFATPADLLQAVGDSRLKLEAADALIVDGAGAIDRLEGFEAAETLAGLVPSDAQKAVFGLPFPDTLESFVEGHVKRAVHLPPGGGVERDAAEAPHRGTLHYHTADEDRAEAVLRAVALLLDRQDVDHALLHVRSDEEAAEIADVLTLHGYDAGAPGDASVAVWLGTDDGESRRLLDELDGAERIATLSVRVPMDADALDRRHGRGGTGLTLIRARELPHLKRAARVAGYALAAVEPPDTSLARDVEGFRERIRAAVESEDLAAYHLLLEPLSRRYGAARVAAAAAALLRDHGADTRAETPSAERPPAETPAAERGWVRLFMSLGRRDDAGPGDILGAITGEARIDGSRVGRIDIRDTFSLVEVDPGVAETVIEAMNGTTVKGRSVRVDFDRARGRGGGGSAGRGRRQRGSREGR